METQAQRTDVWTQWGGEGGRAVSEHRRHRVENSQAVAGEDGSCTQDTQETGEALRTEQHKDQALLLTRRRAETSGAGERLRGSVWETGQTDRGAHSRGRETSRERAGIAQAETESLDWERGDGSRIAGGGDGLKTCARNGQGLVPPGWRRWWRRGCQGAVWGVPAS